MHMHKWGSSGSHKTKPQLLSLNCIATHAIGVETFANQSGMTSREYEKSRFAVPHHILRSEVIYGEGFQSPGGIGAFQQIVLPQLSPSAGERVLEIGSGLGGAAFHLVAQYEVEVVGVDTAETMISIASDRRPRLDPSGRSRFVHGDVFLDALKPASFDAIFCQDTLMYEADKPTVLARCMELLKPGGRLVINDFCEGQSTLEFVKYAEVSGIYPVTIPVYARMATSAGFVDVAARDISTETVEHLRRDLHTYLERAEEDAKIDSADKEHVVDRWRRKIGLLEAGALAQGLIRASKSDKI
ncbi:hypothetical protein QQS21_010493 [Conoideocrella luteorostrata]|uniref:phosphoethanolamine N-methyltransferase n=1 Tax=Conoideocrella luteorostrata TaxID=1105319 RepID=A0AAJ0FWU0_9HYPO|nr:hypothetical protein QQS21_010493 [Conoideocrella luteorostrata]